MNTQKKLTIALAGHANVGKSVIFNHLTGLHQHIGNWPGKTIEKAEGSLYYNNHAIDVLDLPGICSLATCSLEELISRNYIASQHPDFIVNVLDTTSLERNLIFTLQLLELEKPMVLALNMVNLLKEQGVVLDCNKLEQLLGAPTVPVVAIYGKGLTQTLDRGIDLVNKQYTPKIQRYGTEVESRISQLIAALKHLNLPYAKRFLAIKLLEKDEAITQLIQAQEPTILVLTNRLISELETIHGHDAAIVIADERCHLVSQIVKQVVQITKSRKPTVNEFLDYITGHKAWGYLIMILILGTFFFTVLYLGNSLSELIENFSASWQTSWQNTFGVSVLASLVWSGIASTVALFSLAIPFILPCYFILFFLESWGYLARVAYLMDNFMHKLGVHGKACIAMMLGFGCNVNACLACRIMETQRERLISGILATFIPCSAVAIIVFGLTGKFLGTTWALSLYLFIFLIIIALGKLAAIVLPGEPTELIMNMPDYKRPNLRTISLQTWFRLKDFIYIAGPIVVGSGILIEGLSLIQWLPTISNFLHPITVQWLELPPATGILLIFGILRKELILVMLASILGTEDFSAMLTPIQILTLSLISMLYIPCAATIATLNKEFGWQKALGITLFKITFAIIVSGLTLRLLKILPWLNSSYG